MSTDSPVLHNDPSANDNAAPANGEAAPTKPRKPKTVLKWISITEPEGASVARYPDGTWAFVLADKRRGTGFAKESDAIDGAKERASKPLIPKRRKDKALGKPKNAKSVNAEETELETMLDVDLGKAKADLEDERKAVCEDIDKRAAAFNAEIQRRKNYLATL